MDPTQQYITILEKTNQQLSLWWNPISVFISALGILFTIGAIVAGYLLYRQSQDYKKKIESDRKEIKDRFDEFFTNQQKLLEKRDKQVTEVELKLDQLIEQYKKKLNDTTKEQKIEINKALEDLEREKATLRTTIGIPSVFGATGPVFTADIPSGGSASFLNQKIHCSVCNAEFTYNQAQNFGAGTGSIGLMAVYCPNGHRNFV